MAENLYSKLGELTYDGLVTDTNPQIVIRHGTIRKLGTAGTLARGTILAKSSGTAGDGKLVILGTTAETNETLTAYGILVNDTAVGTSADVTTALYMQGCFDLTKCTVEENYDITEDDKDALRNGGIYFRAAAAGI